MTDAGYEVEPYVNAQFYVFGLGDDSCPKRVINKCPIPITYFGLREDGALVAVTPEGTVELLAFTGGNEQNQPLVLQAPTPSPPFPIEGYRAIGVDAGGHILVWDEGQFPLLDVGDGQWNVVTANAGRINAAAASALCTLWSNMDNGSSSMLSTLSREVTQISYPNNEQAEIRHADCATQLKPQARHIAAFAPYTGGVIVATVDGRSGAVLGTKYVDCLRQAATRAGASTNFKRVALTSQRLVGVSEDGFVFESPYGNPSQPFTRARQVSGLSDVGDVAAGESDYIVALTNSGGVYVWGGMDASCVLSFGLRDLLVAFVKNNINLAMSPAGKINHTFDIWPPVRLNCPKADEIAVGGSTLAVLVAS